MEIITTNCPNCHEVLEFPRDFKNLICPRCRTAYHVRQYKDVLSFSPVEGSEREGAEELFGAADLEIVEARLAELLGLIEEVETRIEALRSREQSGPLQ